MVTQVRQPRIAVPLPRPAATAAAVNGLDAGEVDDLTIHYPGEDGEPIAESEWQYIPLTETVAVLRHWFRNRPEVYVIGAMLVYYQMNRNDVRVAPDIFAVFGAAGSPPRNSWLVWREGKAPDFVMEITGAKSWRQDLWEKRDIYAALGATEYWRFDPTGECFAPELAGEQLVDSIYHTLPVNADADGVLRGYSPLLGLEFRVESERRLRVYNPATGERLRTLTESEDALALESAERRTPEAGRESEAAARRAMEDENRLLREQIRRLQAGQ